MSKLRVEVSLAQRAGQDVMSTLIPSLVVCGATCGFLIAFPLQWPIWVIIAISVAALFNAWLILFARKVKKENYFILDLPWWHIWPFAFVLATALPIGWIIYAISFAKMSRYVFLTYRREPKPRVGNPEIDERAEEVALEEAAQVASAELVAQCDQVLAEIAAREAEQAERQREIPTGTTTPNIPGAELVAKIAQTGQRIQQKRADKAAAKIINRSGEGSAPVINHSSDVEKAFALYEHLRSGDDRTKRAKKLVKLLKQRIRETEELLRKFSQAMQGLQGQLNRDRAEFKQNETTLAELATVLETRDTQQEFQRILSLPGVVAIYVKDQALCVQVNARYQYQGSWYDMGDWELQIRDGRKHIYAREIRAGATDEYYRRRRTYEGWLTGDGSGYGYHPDYHMPSDNKDGEFCFAAQSDIIAKHISKGEILNALCLAVLSLQYVNEEDRDYIPDRLRRIV